MNNITLDYAMIHSMGPVVLSDEIFERGTCLSEHQCTPFTKFRCGLETIFPSLAKVEWPPLGSVVNPKDFCVWSSRDITDNAKPQRSVATLIRHLQREWDAILVNTFGSVESVPTRVYAVIRKGRECNLQAMFSLAYLFI